jgi:hypothetical protein
VYDMYHWDQPDPAAGSGTERPGRTGPPGLAGPGGGTGPTGPAAHAVQVALDRRDNGGDVGDPSGK